MNFIVEGKPEGKGRPRFTRAGIAYTPKKTRAYEHLVRDSFLATADHEKIDGPVEVEIIALYKVPSSFNKKKKAQALQGIIQPTKVPDCDNIAKAICDALNGLAYDDDKQIISLKVTKRYSNDELVRVSINKLKEVDCFTT